MGVRVLPGAAVAAVNAGSIVRVSWVFGLATVLFAAPALIETLILRGHGAALPLPLLMLVVLLAGGVAGMLRPTPLVVLAYLITGSAATICYQVALLTADPALVEDSVFLLNRPALALVAVGASVTSARGGIAWMVLGFSVATAAGITASALAGAPYRPGYGPAIVLVVGMIAHLTLVAVQRRARRRMPNFEELEREMLELAHGRRLAQRTTAVVHDTLLGDLAAVMNTHGELDSRTREGLRSDLDRVRGAEWLAMPGTGTHGDEVDAASTIRTERTDKPGGDRHVGGGTHGDTTAEAHRAGSGLRQSLARLVPEYEWRGLTVHLTASGSVDHRLSVEASSLVVDAVRAALENVLRHSGSTVAELEVIADDDELAVLVADHGRGFDPDAIDGDRLGIRIAVRERIEGIGGRVRIWSAPGAGTSVMLTVPALRQHA